MTMPTRIAIVLLAAFAAAFPARAATTTYASSVYSQTGVSNASAALYQPNGVGAVISSGGSLVLNFNNPLTGISIATTLLPLGASPAFNVLAVSIGEVIGGVATFTGEFVIVDSGAGGVLSLPDFSTQCSAISATGCSLLQIRNAFSFNSAGALIDSVSGVSAAPEPAAWMMMMLAFGAIAWRLKSIRAARKGVRRPAARPAFA